MGRRPLHPSRRLALASLSLWVAVSAAACASERAARVELVPERSGDGMCVWAFGDGEQVFQQRYATDRGALLPPSGSLTFVAGARVSEEVVIGARILRGGAIVGERRARIPLADALTERTLRVARCAPFDPEGPLPLEAYVAPGRHEVRASLDGFEDAEDEVELSGPEETAVLSFALTAEPRDRAPPERPRGAGVLMISTTPWSEVYLGGRHLGTTPLANVRLPAGRHVLSLRHPGRPARRHPVSIRAGRTTRVRLAL